MFRRRQTGCGDHAYVRCRPRGCLGSRCGLRRDEAPGGARRGDRSCWQIANREHHDIARYRRDASPKEGGNARQRPVAPGSAPPTDKTSLTDVVAGDAVSHDADGSLAKPIVFLARLTDELPTIARMPTGSFAPLPHDQFVVAVLRYGWNPIPPQCGPGTDPFADRAVELRVDARIP